ncbi:hypothetical protein M8J75_006523 [Diaphorina citri]|nr:hypothetical protein M8J75_006523 [Diaphorina citri]
MPDFKFSRDNIIRRNQPISNQLYDFTNFTKFTPLLLICLLGINCCREIRFVKHIIVLGSIYSCIVIGRRQSE